MRVTGRQSSPPQPLLPLLQSTRSFLVRDFKHRLRDVRSLATVLAMNILMGLFLGGAFSSIRGVTLYKPQAASFDVSLCPAIVRDRCASEPVDQSVLCNFLLIFLLILMSCAAVACQYSFKEERHLWPSELVGRSIGSSAAYCLAKFLLDVPFLVAFACSFCAPVLLLLNPRGSLGGYVGVSVLAYFAACGVGYFVAVAVRRAHEALVASIVVSVVLSLTTGVYPPLADLR